MIITILMILQPPNAPIDNKMGGGHREALGEGVQKVTFLVHPVLVIIISSSISIIIITTTKLMIMQI